MQIKNLKLVNYRNYHSLDINFGTNYNILYGNNAQGKTNIVEAIFLCASGKSHRTSREYELIKIDEDAFYIGLDAEGENNSSKIEIRYKKNDRKKISINEIPVKKIAELIGRLKAVMFSPEDLMLVKEGPAIRRRFMDITLSQLKPAYFHCLQQYSRAILQKNSLLKEIRERNSSKDTLDIWNRRIAAEGARIISERYRFIGKLGEISDIRHKKLTDGRELMQLEYIPSIKNCENKNTIEIEKTFYSILDKSMAKEIVAATSLYGPHRDDFDIRINGLSTKVFGSQGQQRTAVLSLKLSEIDIMRSESGEAPILLLDDVMSELDKSRQEYLMDNLSDVQTFITCTQKDMYTKMKTKNIVYFKVENGNVQVSM